MASRYAAPLPLDAAGLLEPSFELPAPSEAYTVFAQLRDARLDAGALERNAKQFFQTELHLTRPKAYGVVPPAVDGAHVVLVRGSQPTATRTLFVRARSPEDLASAEAAERAMGGGGLSLLAKRCPTVVLVPLESEGDEAALLLAAILASVLLGPIVAPGRPEIFGVRTARLKLEALAKAPLA